MSRRPALFGLLFANRSGVAAEDQVVDSGLTQVSVALNRKRQEWAAWLLERKLQPLQRQMAANAGSPPLPAPRDER